MSFCSAVFSGINSVAAIGSALVSAGTFALAEYTFSTLPSIAKIFGENCPASVVNPPEVCNTYLSAYSHNYYWMIGLNVAAFGTAVAANWIGTKLVTSSQGGDEAIPLGVAHSPPSQRKHIIAAVSIAGGATLGQLFVNLGFSSIAKDSAISLGRCLAQSGNITVLNCQLFESGVYILTTADYVISGVTGLILGATLVKLGVDACRTNRRVNTVYI